MDAAATIAAPPRGQGRDLAAVAACSLIWGTTWYAITFQIAGADAVASIVYRFALAAGLLALICGLRREPLALSPAQHLSAAGLGFFTFAIDYALVYWAEARVASAVVAVAFAALTFINIILFRIAYRERASGGAWAAAGLGILGVAVLSAEELRITALDPKTAMGVLLAFGAVLAAAIGNLFARRGEVLGARVLPFTAWAMGYGAAFLTLYGLAAGIDWRVTPNWAYALSLLHLSVFGSVVAFVLYYGLARRRGFTLASYISALTPPVAMLVSTLFEAKSWTPAALAGLAAIVAGQWLLMRARRS